MAPVDEQYEATFRTAADAAVRKYEDHMGKEDPLPDLLDALTAAARSWVEGKASDRYHEGKQDGRRHYERD